MSAAAVPAYEWQDLDWRLIARRVFKLQKRIYKASCRGNTKTVHKLQRLLMRSWSAKCLAVRKVTQDNRGKKAISAQPPEKVKVRVGDGYAPHSGSLQVCKKPPPLRANCTMILATVCAHLSGTIGPA